MKKQYRHESDCLNCGTTLEGKFCHNCGQENLEIKESFGHMMNHAVSDYFHFDHQFFLTLIPLLFKPGYLTKEYLAGRRVQYLHPIKMYIFISVVYFLLFFQSGHGPVIIRQSEPATKDKKVDSVNREIANDPHLSSNAKRNLINKDTLKSGHFGIKTKAKNKDNGDASVYATIGDDAAISNDTTAEQYETSQNKLPANERDGFFSHLFSKKALTYKEKYGSRALDVFLDEVKHNFPKVMFLLLPLTALIIKITFYRNKKFYVEHLIYTFHLHCFLFLFLGFVILVQMIFPATWHLNGLLSLFAFVCITWYVYRSLRTLYNRSKFRTITKMLGMSITYIFAVLFCIVLVLVITGLTGA